MKIWIIEGRYRVLTSNGYSFGMDRYGHSYKWTYDPTDRLGRQITVEQLPLRARETAEREERDAQRALAVA